MTSIDFARRRARSGRKVLPGNPKQWAFEHNGLDLREELSLDSRAAFPVDRALALIPNVCVLALGDVPIAAVSQEYFRGRGTRVLSGLSVRLPDGTEIVLYNDSHPETRVRATLMEEFFHLRLGHPRSVVRMMGTTSDSGRTFNSAVEQEAFASGAASLVPYAAVRDMIDEGLKTSAIADVFNVSSQLIRYRANVTRLTSRLR